MIKRATKWLCACIAIVMVTSVSGFAQPLIPDFNVGPKVRGGVKAGAVSASLTGSGQFNGRDLESIRGFMVGAFLNIDIPVLPFEIQPELTYIQKGAGLANSESSLQFDYFEVPLLVKVPIAKKAKLIKASLLAGPYVGFNIRSDFDDGFIATDIDQNVTDSEFGVVAGGELQVRNIILGVRYSAAFSDTFESNIGGLSDEKNMTIAAFIGFKFF